MKHQMSRFMLATGTVMAAIAFTACEDINALAEPIPQPKTFFTQSNGEVAKLYTIKNSKGMYAEISNFGGVIYTLNVPDKDGKIQDVILGFGKPEAYANPGPYFGALIGRYANRIGGGTFTIDGKKIQIKQNENTNTLHGGDCYAYRPWTAKQISANKLKLELTSPAGDAGFPGTLKVTALYEITVNNELSVTMTATTDATTAVNFTSHGYYNLSGHDHGAITDHDIAVYADSYQEVNSQNIPTGKLIKVEGTAFDFRKFVNFGDALKKKANGFDNSFIVGNDRKLKLMASAKSRTTGIRMDAYGTDCSVQFYSAGGLNAQGKGGSTYRNSGAFCFEPQAYIDAVNHPEYPSTILKPGETYKQTIVYKFSVEK